MHLGLSAVDDCARVKSQIKFYKIPVSPKSFDISWFVTLLNFFNVCSTNNSTVVPKSYIVCATKSFLLKFFTKQIWLQYVGFTQNISHYGTFDLRKYVFSFSCWQTIRPKRTVVVNFTIKHAAKSALIYKLPLA